MTRRITFKISLKINIKYGINKTRTQQAIGSYPDTRRFTLFTNDKATRILKTTSLLLLPKASSLGLADGKEKARTSYKNF